MKLLRTLGPALFLAIAATLLAVGLRASPPIEAQSLALRARAPMLAADDVFGTPATPSPSPSPSASPKPSPSPSPSPSVAASPSPSPSVSPTATPTATPTVVPGQCSTRKVGSFVDEDGRLHVVGEFVNGKSSVVGLNDNNDGAAVTVTLKGPGGAVLASESGMVFPLFLDSGSDGLFEAAFDSPPAYLSYEVTVAACDAASPLLLQFYPRVRLATVNSSVTSSGGLTVAGTARNTASEETSALASVAVYGADGNVLRVASGDVSPDPLAPGSTGSFSVPLPASAGLVAASHRVWYGP